MDREINERAVISTGAQRHEVFHSDGGNAKLSTAILCVSVCVCLLAHCTDVPACTYVCFCLFVLGQQKNRQNGDIQREKDNKTGCRYVCP